MLSTVVESIKQDIIKLCVVEGCNNRIRVRGFCAKHYERWRRHGDPFTVKLYESNCNVEGCKGKHKGKGYCNFHLDRLRHGTPLTQEKRIVDPSRGCVILNCIRPHWGKSYCKFHYHKFYNPRSWNQGDLHLYIAMKNVRKRDKNTCKWYGCGKTSKQTTIHVNHIFPISEYPELKYLENYMICYCREHHKLWHKKRGDNCYAFL